MVFGAGTALQSFECERDAWIPGGILLNVEVNADCRFTRICGDDCILNMLNPEAQQMTAGEMDVALKEASRLPAHLVRHLALVGKEPMETPRRVLDLLAAYHARPAALRPASIGMITSGVGLQQFAHAARSTPLSWVLVSVDTERVGLRSDAAAADALLGAGCMLHTGAAQRVGAATVIAEEDVSVPELLRLGQRVADAGVSYWSLAPKRHLRHGVLSSVRSAGDFVELVSSLSSGLRARRVEVVGELPEKVLVALAQQRGGALRYDSWRATWHPDVQDSMTRFVAIRSRGGFVRMRADGGLVSMRQLVEPNLPSPVHGFYRPGCMQKIVEDVARVRQVGVGA